MKISFIVLYYRNDLLETQMPKLDTYNIQWVNASRKEVLRD